jgi:FkbM family methyltransferase
MNYISEKIALYKKGHLEKKAFTELMFNEHHSVLFDFAHHLKQTNIKSIEITDDEVVVTTRDRGLRLFAPNFDHRSTVTEILNFFDYEKFEYRMLDLLINDGDVIFDIGANIGYYSLNLALSRRKSLVFAFEPIPETFGLLRRNVSMNAVFNIKINNFALSDMSGENVLYYYAEHSGNASLSNLTGRSDVQEILCKSHTLDSFVAINECRLDFMKVDVEGAELKVLTGGLETIKRFRPIIFAEILRKWSSKFGYDPNEIFDLLRSLGYCSFVVDRFCLRQFDRMDEDTMETNFFFLHSSDHSRLIERFSL